VIWVGKELYFMSKFVISRWYPMDSSHLPPEVACCESLSVELSKLFFFFFWRYLGFELRALRVLGTRFLT
jgi:hypothetical protein